MGVFWSGNRGAGASFPVQWRVNDRKVNGPLPRLVILPLRGSGVAAFGSLRDSGPETAPKER